MVSAHQRAKEEEVIGVPRGSPSAVTPSIGVLFEPNRNKYMIFRFCSDAFESEEISYKYEIYTANDGEWGRVSEVEQCPVVILHALSFLLIYVSVEECTGWSGQRRS